METIPSRALNYSQSRAEPAVYAVEICGERGSGREDLLSINKKSISYIINQRDTTATKDAGAQA